MRKSLPSLAEIEQAQTRISEFIRPTPLEYSPALSSECGRGVFLKQEVFQPIRVFKIRGALNKLLCLGDSARKRGVLTASSGNHGLAIAYSSKLFGLNAVVCVPENANPQKVRAIQEQGAEVVKAGSNYDAAYENGLKIAERRNLTFVHAFDDRDIIAGQGTCGLEISQQSSEVDSAVVAIGGGGLISGVSIALKKTIGQVQVYGAETTAIPSMFLSVRSGQRVSVRPKQTIADGMQAATPGVLTFEAVSKNVDRIELVSDEELRAAIYELLIKARTLAEPAGAAPLAALRGPLKGAEGKNTVLVISGGNISPSLLSEILEEGLSRQGRS
jgi:threonine dehydratase